MMDMLGLDYSKALGEKAANLTENLNASLNITSSDQWTNDFLMSVVIEYSTKIHAIVQLEM